LVESPSAEDKLDIEDVEVENAVEVEEEGTEEGRGRKKERWGETIQGQRRLVLLRREHSQASIGLICLLGVTTVTAAIVYRIESERNGFERETV